MNFLIRKAKKNDTRRMWESHQESLKNICLKDYSSDQIQKWAAFKYSHEYWVATMAKDQVWVVESENKVEGFGHLGLFEDFAEIHGLYISPKVIGLGAGRTLVKEMLNKSREYNMKKVILSSTVTAKEFYLKMGFTIDSGMQVDNIRGAEIECFQMTLKL